MKLKINDFEVFLEKNISAVMIVNPYWLEYLLNLFSQGYRGEIWEEIQNTKINHCKEIERVGYGVINLLALTSPISEKLL